VGCGGCSSCSSAFEACLSNCCKSFTGSDKISSPGSIIWSSGSLLTTLECCSSLIGTVVTDIGPGCSSVARASSAVANAGRSHVSFSSGSAGSGMSVEATEDGKSVGMFCSNVDSLEGDADGAFRLLGISGDDGRS
jgi:hypothetical protein